MNHSYTRVTNNEVLVRHEEEKGTLRDYNTNIKEILEQENVIECLEKNIESKKEQFKAKHEEFANKKADLILMPLVLPILLFGIGIVIQLSTMLSFLMKVDVGSLSIVLKAIVVIPVIASLGLGVYSIVAVTRLIKDYRHSKLTINNHKDEMEYLYSVLELEKNKLQSLKSKSLSDNEPNNIDIGNKHQIDIISSLQYLKQILDMANLYAVNKDRLEHVCQAEDVSMSKEQLQMTLDMLQKAKKSEKGSSRIKK